MTSGMKVAGVIGVPFSTTRTTFFPNLERGSFFQAFILAYNSWLNLVVISTQQENGEIKNKNKKGKEETKENSNKPNSLFSSILIVRKMKGECSGPRK